MDALCHAFGAVMHNKQWQPCPIALYPQSITKNDFQKLQQNQHLVHQLKLQCCQDPKLLEALSIRDDFVDALLKIRVPHKILFGIIRTDYMRHSDNSYRMVEANCIASSFGYLSQQVAKCHHSLYPNILPNHQIITKALNAAVPYHEKQSSVPDCMLSLSEDSPNGRQCILMIVQSTEANIADQLGIQDGLDVPLFRITFDQVQQLSRHQGTLLYQHHIVAVVYYRAGYRPEDYNDFTPRLILESSDAINCPSVHLQLMGLKKIQQLTSSKSQLSQYMEKQAEAMSAFHVPLFTMDQSLEEGRNALALVQQDPSQYVMKPQREGGANNYYGEEILDHLSKIDIDAYQQYILMERISGLRHSNTLIKYQNGIKQDVEGQCVSEIGVFGYMIAKEGKMLKDDVQGYIVRTKLVGTDEGGVATGYSCLNSLQLE